MTKSIYEATFSESENFVTEKYIKKAIEESGEKDAKKSIWVVLGVNLFTIGLYYFISFITTFEPIDTMIFPLYLKYYWFISSSSLFIYYVFRYSRYKNFKILNSYESNRVAWISIGNMGLLMFLFTLTVADSVMNSYFLAILYSILFIIFCINVNLKINDSIKKALYTDVEYSNRFTELVDSFIKFARRYGGIIVLGMVLVRRFVFNFKSNDFIEQIAGAFAPLLGFFLFWFVISMKEETMQGYYLKKYPEEYRVKYGCSKKEWYGEKSKEYKKELAEQ